MKTKLLLAALLCCVPLGSSSAQTVDEIIKKAIDARGGIDKIKAVESERITGRVAFSQGIEGTVVLELERPHKLYSEITVEGQKVLRAYDGKSAGWTVNPFTENKDVVVMSADELKEMPDESDVDGPLVDYKSKGSQVELVGKEDWDGKAVYRLKITTRSGEVRSYLIDGGTFLTTKWVGTRKVNSRAAKALRMAAQSLHHTKSFLDSFYRRMRTKPITAGAHKLARIIFRLVTVGQESNQSRFADDQLRHLESQEIRLRARAWTFGFKLVPFTQEATH